MFGAKARNELMQKQIDELKDSVSNIIESQKTEIEDCKQQLKILQQEIDNLRYGDDQLGKYKEQA